jgi:hypothetical protein
MPLAGPPRRRENGVTLVRVDVDRSLCRRFLKTDPLGVTDLDIAIQQFDRTNAFNEPESDDRLILPRNAESV